MTALRWICSIPLIAEFTFAPFNLWSDRTMPNFVRFTGLYPDLARRVVAPLKLIGALLLAVGLAVGTAGAVGAALLALISAFYLWRLLGQRRRHIDGLCAFSLSLILAVAAMVLELAR